MAMRPISFGTDGSSSGRSATRSIVTPINSRRPVTGAGGLARQRMMPNDGVESAGYYSNLLQQKSQEIIKEIQRLQSETEMADGTSDARKKLEVRHKNAIQDIQQLEATLANINLAKEKKRAGYNYEDIHEETVGILNRNKAIEREIDEIFVSRKRIESQILKVQLELEKVIGERKQKLSQDPGMLYEFERVVDLIGDMQEEERKLIQLDEDGEIDTLKENSQARYSESKKRVVDLERQIEQVELDIELASMENEFDARKHLLDKVKKCDTQQKHIDKKIAAVQSEIDTLVNEQSQLQTQLRLNSYTPKKESKTIELLYERDDEQKKFIADVPKLKAQIEEDIAHLTASIQTLEQEIDKQKGAELQLPSKDELDLMKDEVDFTSKHLSNNKNTWSLLQRQKKAREAELQKILSLEDKIDAELNDIETKTSMMKAEMSEFESPDELQASADAKRDDLIEVIEEYTQKIHNLDSQLIEATTENEQKKKVLESQPNWKSVVLLKSKLQDQDKEINEMRSKIDDMEAQNYDDLKAKCMSLVNEINSANLAKQ